MKPIKICLISLLVMFAASTLWACSVPVFRYALERWTSDSYQVVLYHKEPLSADQQKILADLTEAGAAGKQHANVELTVVDLNKSDDSKLVAQWEAEQSPVLPWFVVKFPQSTQKQIKVWSGELTQQNVDRLLDSPTRRAIARSLLKGQTAVWVLLESGDQSKDDAAFETLQSNLLLAQQELQLPKIDEEDIKQGLTTVDETGLKLEFSIVRLSRTNAEEKMFIEMLLSSEDDLRELDGAMAFPVFGRGRVLFSLTGPGINAGTIRRTCMELIGPCTCEIKDENPGVDLITSVDWDHLVEPSVEIDRALPALPGLGGIMNVTATRKESENKLNPPENADDFSATGSHSQTNSSVTEPQLMNSVMYNVLLLIGVCVVVLFLSSLFILLKR